MYLIGLAALGYLSGHALSHIAEEELLIGRRHFLFFARLLFIILAFYLLGLASVLLAIIFLFLLNKKQELFFISVASGILLGLNDSPFVASLCFLLGMPIASLEKKWHFALLSFVLSALPWGFFHF